MRFARSFAAVLVVGSSFAVADRVEAQGAAPVPGATAKPDASKLPAGKTITRQSPGEALIREALDNPAELELKETSLAALAKQVGEKHKISVVLDLAELKANEKGPETKLQGSGGKTTLRKALRTLLHNADLTFVVRNDALVFTSIPAGELETPVRIYQVHDLVIAPNDAAGWPNYESLIELITATIVPETWREAGGTQGEIKSFDGPGVMALVVTQTEEVHEQVEALLANLREAKVPGLAELQSRRQGKKPAMQLPWVGGINLPWPGFPNVPQPGDVEQPGTQQANPQPPTAQPTGTPRQGGGYF